MRIAFFTDVFPRLSNTFITNQATGLIDLGHELDIYAPGVGDFGRAHEVVGEYDLAGRMRHIPIPESKGRRLLTAARHLAGRGNWNRGTLLALNPLLQGREALSLGPLYGALSLNNAPRYDAIHVQFAKLGRSIIPLARARGLDEPVLVAVRGADLTRHVSRNPARYREMLASTDMFLPVSESLKALLQDLGVPAERIRVHHSGIQVQKFAFTPRQPAPDGTVQLLFIGRLTEKKGVRYLLEALANLDQRVRLTILGDGEERSGLEELAGRLGVSGRVTWRGSVPQEEVLRELVAAHILVAPSVTAADGDQEGIPNVLKEAMATGMPVVSTWHSGVPELVEDGVSGLLAAERDSAGLARKLQELIDLPERWAAMGAAGREVVSQRFDSDKLNRELAKLYEELSSRRRP